MGEHDALRISSRPRRVNDRGDLRAVEPAQLTGQLSRGIRAERRNHPAHDVGVRVDDSPEPVGELHRLRLPGALASEQEGLIRRDQLRRFRSSSGPGGLRRDTPTLRASARGTGFYAGRRVDEEDWDLRAKPLELFECSMTIDRNMRTGPRCE